MRSRLYAGNLRHRRTSPKAYQFAYGVFYCDLDLDEIDEVARRIRLFSYNRRNMMSFQDRDHLYVPGGTVRDTVRGHLEARGIDLSECTVSLLTNTRIMNYVFNPVSFYFVRDGAGAVRHIMAEVHNTSGEMHLYDLDRAAGCSAEAYVAEVQKEFYVSPFIDMAARYEFRCSEDEGGRWDIQIDEFQHGELFFQAQLEIKPMAMTNTNVVKMLARYPLMTLKTIGLIHWHGLKLWLRGVKYQPNPRRRTLKS